MLFTGIGIGLAVLVIFVIIYIMTKLRTVVPTNMVDIVQTSKSTTPYGRGFTNGNTYYAWPAWVPKLGISVSKFPTSNFEIRLQGYDAYDKERLPFLVDIIAFFRLEDLIIVSQRVASFEELKTQLHSIVQGAVRRILASEHLEFILSDRSSLGDSFTNEVQAQLANWGVTSIKTIEFMDIRDSSTSTVIQDIKAKKESAIKSESRVAIATSDQIADAKEIETRRVTDINKQEAEQQVGLRTAEKNRIVGIAQEQAKQAIQEESKVTIEKQMEVLSVQETRQAEINKQVAITQAEQRQRELVIKAEAEKESKVTLAEAQLEANKKDAEGQLAIQTANAQGVKALGEAKAESERLLQMASVTAQTELAKEIGNNEGYQTYLIEVKKIEQQGQVGIETAKALEKANIQIIGSGSDNAVGKFVGTQGGLSLSSMMAAFASTDAGKTIVNNLTNTSSSTSN